MTDKIACPLCRWHMVFGVDDRCLGPHKPSTCPKCGRDTRDNDHVQECSVLLPDWAKTR